MGRRGYPQEFRRKVLDLIDAGRPVVEVARDLGISAQSIYVWRKQDRIDKGLEPGRSGDGIEDQSIVDCDRVGTAAPGSRCGRLAAPGGSPSRRAPRRSPVRILLARTLDRAAWTVGLSLRRDPAELFDPGGWA